MLSKNHPFTDPQPVWLQHFCEMFQQFFHHNLKAIKIQNNIGHPWLSLRGQDIFQNVSKKVIHVWNYKNRHALPEWQHLFGCLCSWHLKNIHNSHKGDSAVPHMTHTQNISVFLSTPTPPFPTKSLAFSQAYSHKTSFLQRAGETDLWLEMRKRDRKGKKKKELVKERIRERGKGKTMVL